jgi:uncharacterized protein YmfQ (DUF2313 family)
MWPRNPASVHGQLLLALGQELSRIEGLGDTLISEAVDPGNAVMMLPDYERVLGPDPYGRDTSAMTIAQRQQIVLQRWVESGGQSRAFYIALAAVLGVTITIGEFAMPMSGVAQCGVAQCGQSPSEFYWTVSLPQTEVVQLECGGASCGDGAYVATSPVQPVIAALAPAHTTPIFLYE